MSDSIHEESAASSPRQPNRPFRRRLPIVIALTVVGIGVVLTRQVTNKIDVSRINNLTAVKEVKRDFPGADGWSLEGEDDSTISALNFKTKNGKSCSVLVQDDYIGGVIEDGGGVVGYDAVLVDPNVQPVCGPTLP